MIDMPDFTTEQEPKKTKKINYGKIFEKDFKDSIPDNVFFYRFRDSSGAWQQSENTRFTPSNISDTMLFYQGKLYLLELKTRLQLLCIYQNCIRDNFDKYIITEDGFFRNPNYTNGTEITCDNVKCVNYNKWELKED